MIRNRVVGNAFWMIGCRVIQAGLGILITMLTARYLGPSNYGLINYATSLVAFVVPITRLGLDSILVNELINHPEHEGEILGTSLAISVASGILCMCGLAAFTVLVNPNEEVTLVVCVLYSFVLLAYAIELIQFWFQAHLKSKYTAIATLVAYVVKSVYQVILLLNGSSVYWFAISSALDIFIIDTIIVWLYWKITGQRLSISMSRARKMLEKSKYYIISSMMVTIFANTDRIMIKMMMGDAQTGYYSAAVTCAGLTSFVFSAIIYSMQPVILENYRKNTEKYHRTLTLLYVIVIYLSLMQCVFITLLSPVVIQILYGANYYASIEPLRLIVWYTTFSYLGAVRNIWIIANELHRLLWKINFIGAFGNVILNLVLIQVLGINGAALASLLTQFITNVVLCYVFKDLRPTIRYMKESMYLTKVIRTLKQSGK